LNAARRGRGLSNPKSKIENRKLGGGGVRLPSGAPSRSGYSSSRSKAGVR
jgi:hypothetical protein